MRGTAEEASKDVLSRSVGNSSALLSRKPRPLIACFGALMRESGSHNPEVVGSNPAPATRNKIVHQQVGDFIFCYGRRLAPMLSGL